MADTSNILFAIGTREIRNNPDNIVNYTKTISGLAEKEGQFFPHKGSEEYLPGYRIWTKDYRNYPNVKITLGILNIETGELHYETIKKDLYSNKLTPFILKSKDGNQEFVLNVGLVSFDLSSPLHVKEGVERILEENNIDIQMVSSKSKVITQPSRAEEPTNE